ncbi:UNVERIFIED_CONTAM: hypothetical protein Sradi_6825900 [Sesamum radiatum]|uniref:Uncharacterized protein n=1 Tax=Sesamum radiatum TaxID=300843 RepID=A0AAW2JU99_SESRA
MPPSAVPCLIPPAVAPCPSLPIKHLSPLEMHARRVKGLCFNCDERFVPGHRCKPNESSPSPFPESDRAVLAALPLDLAALLHHYAAVFVVPRSLPPSRSHDHHIQLVPNASPINTSPYHYPHCQKEAMVAMIAEMLR